MLNILIADDHLVFRMGLKTMLGTESDMHVVGEANTGTSTVEAFARLRPDIILLDLRMPGGGGMHAIAAIRQIDEQAPILVLSSYAFEEEVYAALRAGASGYILKDVDQVELTAAIRKICSGQRYLPVELAALIAERAPRPELTRREHEVLQLIARGLINREIARILGMSESTVRNHTIHLFAKLDVSDRTEAATFALQRGIIRL